MDARELARFLTIQFRYTSHVFKANLEGMSDADALRQPGPAGLAFHEAYHTGQLGVLRRLAGRPGAIT